MLRERLRIIAFSPIVHVAKNGIKLKKFLLAKRVKFVIVTSGALQGASEPGRRSRRDAVNNCEVKAFGGVDSAFLIEHRVSMETCRDQLVSGRIGQHVSCELFNRELVVGQVLVECVDHPISIQVSGATEVSFVSVCVGITCQIKPHSGLPLTIMTRSEQFVDELLVSIWSRVV